MFKPTSVRTVNVAMVTLYGIRIILTLKVKMLRIIKGFL